VTMRLFSTVTEIWRLKDNGVTSLTFWCHVASSTIIGKFFLSVPKIGLYFMNFGETIFDNDLDASHY